MPCSLLSSQRLFTLPGFQWALQACVPSRVLLGVDGGDSLSPWQVCSKPSTSLLVTSQ